MRFFSIAQQVMVSIKFGFQIQTIFSYIVRMRGEYVVFAIYLCGIYLFTQGYLLTRLALPDISTESSIATFNKTVFVVVDALRYDFMAPSKLNSFYTNHLPILTNTLKTSPKNAAMLKVIADSPTTTMQRLLALMTGTLPTLIDASSNFNSGNALNEDSLIAQIYRQNGSVRHVGDDTWCSLFPSMNETHPMDSFNVPFPVIIGLGSGYSRRTNYTDPLFDRQGHPGS